MKLLLLELGLEERDGGLLLTRIALILFWYIALVDVLSGLAFKVLPPCLNLLHDILAVLSCLWTLHDMQVRVFTKYHASSSFLWMNITWTRITNINRVGSMNLAIYIFLLYAFCFFTACGLFAIYLWYTVYADIFYSWRYNRCYSSSCITKTTAHWHNIRYFCWFEIRSLFDR